MQVRWTKRASLNLESILSHIAHDNPDAARRFLIETLEKIAQLSEFPYLGREGLVPTARELVVHANYIVHYRVQSEQVQILRVLHVKRKYP